LVFRVFFGVFFPIKVEKKGGWQRRMKGKRVFEEGRRKGRSKRERDKKTST